MESINYKEEFKLIEEMMNFEQQENQAKYSKLL